MFWFNLEGLLIAGVLSAVAVGCLIAFVRWRRLGIPLALVAAYLFLTAGFVVASIDRVGLVLRDIDFRMALPSMTEAMERQSQRAWSSSWPEGMYPTGSGAFFLRWTFFSPDPYCGYEFVRPAGSIETDPLGSGGGVAVSLGVPGWYWICAS